MAETTPPAAIAMQVAQAVAVLERHLGNSLLTVHLFGSAVDGGLKPSSDIDLLVIVHQPPSDAVRCALMTELLSVSAWPATDVLRPLEVTVLAREAVRPWVYPARRELQFGEWLREDIEAGRLEPAMLDHDLAILLTKARRHSLRLRGLPLGELLAPIPATDLANALHDTTLQWNEPADWMGDERNVVLALARIWLTLATGEIAAKDVAADWALVRLPETHHAVLENARASYVGTALDELAGQPEALTAFVRDVRAEIERLRGFA